MIIHSQRFGSFEVEDGDAIHFPEGLVGFPDERSFVLLRLREGSRVGWLQSTTNKILAFPVISVDALEIDGPYTIGMTESEDGPFAVMAVVCAPPDAPPTVNLLAPIVVDVTARRGAQIFIANQGFSTTDRLVFRRNPDSGGEHSHAGANGVSTASSATL